MPNPLKLLSVAACALSFAAPLAAQDADTVVASVNGTDITLGHMILVRAGLPEQYQQLPDQVLFDGILEQVINQVLLSGSEEATESKRVRLALENERLALMASEAAEKIAAAAVTDAALEAAYQSEYLSKELGREYNASHILVETEEAARAIVEELAEGAEFAAVAREKSTGPSGPNGGALGWFAAGMMVQPFQDAVEKLAVGEVSQPVQTQFGWHVIILNELRDKEAPSLEEVRAELSQQLQSNGVQSRLEELNSAATITRADEGSIDPALLKNLSLLEE